MMPRLAILILPLVLAASTPMADGIRAFEDGDLAEAARKFSEGGPRDEASLRSYNAGVARLLGGEVDEAIARLEEAAVGSEGALRSAALHNLALAHATRGDALRDGAPEEDEEARDDRIERLTQAATSYRRSLALFRRVPPPASDADAGAKAAKMRLLAALDEIRRLAEEARREAEEEALKNPAALILALQTGERDRRRIAARLATLDRRRSRRPVRALRKAESEARRLTEKLAVALENPAEAAPAPGASPTIPPEHGKRAAAEIREAAKAMGEAEGRLQGLDAKSARAEQTAAIAKLRAAGLIVVAPLPALVGKLIGDQAGLLDATRAGDSALVPEEQGEIGAWVEAFTTLPDPPEPAEGQPATLTKEIVAKIRALAGEALDASRRAATHLLEGRAEESAPDQETVLAKLEAIRDLLPKPPKSPAERIRELIEKERETRTGIDGLPGLNDEARRAVEADLESRQRGHGREAGAIGKELGDSPGEKEKAAAGKVEEAETEIFDSAESLARSRDEPAGDATDRAIERLEEALAILSGEEGDQKDPSDQENRPDESGEEEREGNRQDPRRLDAAEARRMMEEMDRDRRDEEKKLFPGGGGMKVDKDW